MKNELQEFHRFIGENLKNGNAGLSPEQALTLWRERRETIDSIQRGLDDIDAGQTKSLEDFLRHFSQRREISQGQ